MAPVVGRPRAFDPAQVLEAAMRLFWEQGYEATSMAQLRQATGLSSASLYGAFGSKLGLFERAVEHYVARQGWAKDVLGNRDLSAPEAITRMLHTSIDLQTDPDDPRGCLIALTGAVGAPGDEDSAVRQTMRACRAVERERIKSCVVRGIATGEFPDGTAAEAVTVMIHGFLLGISTQVCDGTPVRDLHAAADALLAAWRAPVRTAA